MSPPPSIDPALASRLADAASGERIEALLLLSPAAATRLRIEHEGVAAGPSGRLPAIVEKALGAHDPAAIEARPFAALGALFVAGPAEVLRRLLTDPDIASATLPDHSQ
jgi:hypothetical protein